jgi:50S ribosomal subunit-associated GTPase HflX
VTVDHILEHIQYFLSVNPNKPIVIALNKSDLVDDEKLLKILDFTSSKLPKQVIATYSTSAKTGSQVDQIFQRLAYQMIEPE